MTYHPLNGRGYGHVTGPLLDFAVCRDAARRAGLSATADPCQNSFTGRLKSKFVAKR